MSNTDANGQTTSDAADFPRPAEGILLAQFVVSADVERSRRFYTDVPGGGQRETAMRCYLRDPDGHLVEVGQRTRAPTLQNAASDPR